MPEVSYIEWFPADQPPKLGSWDYASVKVLAVVEELHGKCTTRVLIYQRTIIRKKKVERWEDVYGRIFYDKVLLWAYLPEPPKAEGV